MRLLPVLLAVFAVLVLVEVAVNVLLRPQVGPPALAAVFEPYLLAAGAVAAVVAVLITLGDRGAGASRLRLVAIVMLVVAIVRLGGEWWSPDAADSDVLASETTPLTVMTWNLELGSKATAESVEGILGGINGGDGAQAGPDLVALQELTPEVAAALEAAPGIDSSYPYRILEPRDGVAGMGLLSRYPLVVGSYATEPVVLRADLLLPDGARIDVLNAHPYPPEISRAFGGVPIGLDTRRRDEHLSVLAAKVDQAEDRARVLLVGDLNATPFEYGFGRISAGLLDAHGEAATGTGFTWRPSRLESLGVGLLRIDHVLTGTDLRPVAATQDCSIPGDHCRLLVTLEVAAGE
jgi:endonuclease/exonuclease/phosphatase (EEP) superfamily protein YafD